MSLIWVPSQRDHEGWRRISKGRDYEPSPSGEITSRHHFSNLHAEMQGVFRTGSPYDMKWHADLQKLAHNLTHSFTHFTQQDWLQPSGKCNYLVLADRYTRSPAIGALQWLLQELQGRGGRGVGYAPPMPLLSRLKLFREEIFPRGLVALNRKA